VLTVLGVQAGIIEKSPLWAAGVCEASSINERGEIGARRLGRLFVALENDIGTDTRNESKGSRSNNE
jgi:hypothetical protein